MNKAEIIRKLEELNFRLANISAELSDAGLDEFARRIHAQELKLYEVLEAILDTQND